MHLHLHICYIAWVPHAQQLKGTVPALYNSVSLSNCKFAEYAAGVLSALIHTSRLESMSGSYRLHCLFLVPRTEDSML